MQDAIVLSLARNHPSDYSDEWVMQRITIQAHKNQNKLANAQALICNAIKCVKIHHLIAVSQQNLAFIGTRKLRWQRLYYRMMFVLPQADIIRFCSLWGITMSKINLLLLCGGGSAEHDISLMSANYFETSLAKSEQFSVLRVELDKFGQYRTAAGDDCELTNSREIRFRD